MKKIFFFTNTYPYEIGELWKTNELKILKKHFDIFVIPFYKSKKLATPYIEGITYEKAILQNNKDVRLWQKFLRILFSKHIYIFLKEFSQKKPYKNKSIFYKWIAASYRMIEIKNSNNFSKYLKKVTSTDILYFFWGREASEVIPILETKSKIIVRFHGYDLYEDRNNNYIPYREFQLKKLHTAIFVSEQGKKYLTDKYNYLNFKAKLFRLGTIEFGKAQYSQDKTLRIISCSSVIPLKRIELLAEAVQKLDIPVEWTHIGGGHLLPRIKQKYSIKTKEKKIIFVGQIKSNDVKKYYNGKTIDLFINVSTTEGVPVSIMEAMSAAIPIYATNVGGTHEIVDETNGKLLPADINSDLLTNEIKKFYVLPLDKKIELRNNSYKKFQKMCDAKKNAQELANYLKKI